VLRNTRTDRVRRHRRQPLHRQGQGGPDGWSGGLIVAGTTGVYKGRRDATRAAEPTSTHAAAIAAHSSHPAAIAAHTALAIGIGLGRADEVLLTCLVGIGADETTRLPGLTAYSVGATQGRRTRGAALGQAAQGTIAAERTTGAGRCALPSRAVAEHAAGRRPLGVYTAHGSQQQARHEPW
jgi:hypothetical protein